MKTVAKVPLRVSLFGGGTDIPPYANEYGGKILFCTINRYACCEIEPVPEGEAVLLGDTNEKYQEGDEEYTGRYGLVKAVLHEVKLKGGCRIKIYSDVLQGTGLGGSSAQIAAVILACYSWQNKDISKRELAKLTYHVERVVMKVQGGYQDPITTVYGGIGYLKVRDIENFEVEKLVLDEERIKGLRKYLLLYYTGIQHDSSRIMKDHIKVQVDGKERIEETLYLIKKLAEEAKAVLEQGEIAKLGAMLHHGWERKKRMSIQVSSDYINALYENARKAGAQGGKILGAGGGGYLLLFSEPNVQQAVRKFLSTEQGEIDESWEFDFTGARVEDFT